MIRAAQPQPICGFRFSDQPDGTRLYVTQINFDRVTVVDIQTLEIVDDIPVESAWNVAVTPDGTRAYVVGFATPGVSVIALQTPTDPAVVV
jgi:YVTN family beta-propeller protein